MGEKRGKEQAEDLIGHPTVSLAVMTDGYVRVGGGGWKDGREREGKRWERR